MVKYYMNEMVERFCTTGHDSSGISTSWDELRGVILQEGLTMYLQPMALKYCRKKLTEHSHRVIIQEASKKLWYFFFTAVLVSQILKNIFSNFTFITWFSSKRLVLLRIRLLSTHQFANKRLYFCAKIYYLSKQAFDLHWPACLKF